MTEVNDLLALDTVVAVGHEEVDIYNYGLTYINGAVSYIGRNACEASGGHVIALVLDVEIHKTGLNIGDLLCFVVVSGSADAGLDLPVLYAASVIRFPDGGLDALAEILPLNFIDIKSRNVHNCTSRKIFILE